MKNRRGFIKNAATAVAGGLVAPSVLSPKAMAGTHMVLENEWDRNFPPPPHVYERLDQGSFERVIPEIDRFGLNVMITMKCLDANGNYWALWQNAGNILKFREAYPRGFRLLDRHLGYKVRPAWVFVETKNDPQALIVAIRNDGCAAPPGILRIYASNAEGTFKVGGGFDPGRPGPFSLHQGRIVLPPGIRWEDVRLSAGIEIKGTTHPVRWACAEKLNDDGSINLRPTPGLQPITRSNWADDDSFAPANFRYPGNR